MMKGVVFNIQRCSLDDGPGVRTTVFLKGCWMRCLWCHNPEGQSPWPEMMGGELVGREMTVDEIMAVVMRDAGHYRATGGGLTLSGGEPLCQPEFSAALLRNAKAEGLHTCVETCGVPFDAIDTLLPFTDLWLYDIKADSSLHERLTGVPLEPVIDGLKHICARGGRVVLRCPMVPGVNDTPAHISHISELECLDCVEGVQFMPYHNTGQYKYEQLNRKYGMENEFTV